jgi:PAS domain S-box-containing protein
VIAYLGAPTRKVATSATFMIHRAHATFQGANAEAIRGNGVFYAAFRQSFAVAAITGLGDLNTYTTESKFRRRDGTSGWARVTSTAVRNIDGTFLYAVRVVEDITERRRANRRQKLLIDELNHRVKNTLATVQRGRRIGYFGRLWIEKPSS